MRRGLTCTVGVALAAVLLLALTGCSKKASLETFDSCDDLEAYIESLAIEELTWTGSNTSWGGVAAPMGAQEFDASGDDDDWASEDSGSLGGPNSSGGLGGDPNRDYSTTNTQEVEVDEADIVKNDDTYFYLVSGQDLVVVQAWPADDLNVVSRFTIEGQPTELYLDGDIVAVLSLMFGDVTPQGNDDQDLTGFVTKISILDVSDRSDPQLQREIYVEGSLYSSRRVDGMLYLITYRDLGDFGLSSDTSSNDIKDRVHERDMSDWMPTMVNNVLDGSSWSLEQSDVCGCSDVYKANRDGGLEMMSVMAVDISDPRGELSGTSVIAGTGEVYATPYSLYMAVYEPNEGPFRVTSGGFGTRIHRFALDGGGHPQYAASGRVDGWAHNSFAMDEANDTFRIATTVFAGSQGTESTGVYVLTQDADKLKVIGEVTNIAPQEDVYSVRFMDDVAYVVTFGEVVRWMDPLFTIDLTDPTDPTILGELEITGYSTYMHPMGDGHLLAVGEEIDPDSGWIDGLAVTLFDVSDLNDPQMADRQVIETSWDSSQALVDHHAFTYYEPHDMLAIPVTLTTDTWGGDVYYSGLAVFEVTVEDGVQPAGQMDSSELIDDSADYYYAVYCSQIRRSIVIEDMLYGVSAGGIISAPVADPGDTSDVLPFPDYGNCDEPWEWWQETEEDW